MFELRFRGKAKKFIEKCDEKTKNRLKETFQKLSQLPVPFQEYDVKKLTGEQDIYRIRIGKHRIIYAVYWEEKIIRIIKIERRKDRTYNF